VSRRALGVLTTNGREEGAELVRMGEHVLRRAAAREFRVGGLDTCQMMIRYDAGRSNGVKSRRRTWWAGAKPISTS
jgi:hypothetical protein